MTFLKSSKVLFIVPNVSISDSSTSFSIFFSFTNLFLFSLHATYPHLSLTHLPPTHVLSLSLSLSLTHTHTHTHKHKHPHPHPQTIYLFEPLNWGWMSCPEIILHQCFLLQPTDRSTDLVAEQSLEGVYCLLPRPVQQFYRRNLKYYCCIIVLDRVYFAVRIE